MSRPTWLRTMRRRRPANSARPSSTTPQRRARLTAAQNDRMPIRLGQAARHDAQDQASRHGRRWVIRLVACGGGVEIILGQARRRWSEDEKSVGYRVRTQVTLHVLAEKLDDRPWARE